MKPVSEHSEEVFSQKILILEMMSDSAMLIEVQIAIGIEIVWPFYFHFKSTFYPIFNVPTST